MMICWAKCYKGLIDLIVASDCICRENSMTEKQTLNLILTTFATRPDVRLWRNNVGTGVPSGIVAAAVKALRSGDFSSAIRILSSRQVSFGIPGQADLTGILPGGIRLEIEVKSAVGKQRIDQQNYQRMIERFGGVYVLARSIDDVWTAIGKYIGVDVPSHDRAA